MAYSKNLSLARSFALLEALNAHHTGMTASDVAAVTGLPTSTAHRFLRNLHQLGYVSWEPETKLYTIGFALTLFGNRRAIIDRIAKRARPIMRELSLQTEMAVYLASLEGPHVVIEQRVTPEQATKGAHAIGERIDAHAHSLGKTLLALIPRMEFQRVYEARALRTHTRHTITDIEGLAREVTTVRRLGYALDVEELSLGTGSIGCALLNPKGRALCSLSIEGSRHRLPPSRRDSLVAALFSARARIMQSVR